MAKSNTASKKGKAGSSKKKVAGAKKAKAAGGKKAVVSKKKAAAGVRHLALAPAGAAAAIDIPSTPASCQIWRGQHVFQRIMDALAAWSGQPVGNITSTTTLGALAQGVPWGIGQQARLVQATNDRHVFAPFQSVMAPPTVLLPSTTTVAQWMDVVWRQQQPQTFCFVFAG